MKITWLITDNDINPITGGSANTSIKIRRLSDGYMLDWNDGVFKNSGWVSLTTAMTEISPSNLAGWYEKVVSEASWNDGVYQIITGFDNGSIKRFGYSQTEVKDGSEVLLGELEVSTDLTAEGIINELFGRLVEGGINYVTMLKILGACMAGKLSGVGTTQVKIRDLTDALDRVTIDYDTSGNRINVVFNLN